MCNSKNSAVRENVSYGLLDQCVCFLVYCGSCLIKYQHLCLTQDGTGQAHQLPLSSTRMM